MRLSRAFGRTLREAPADADLLGLPLRVTLGSRGLRRGEAELRRRATGETETVPLEGAAAQLARRVPDLSAGAPTGSA